MLNDLIAKHQELHQNLSKALEADDEAEIRRLDKELGECHDAVVAHEPRSLDEMRGKFAFLLEMVREATEESPYLAAIFTELLELFEAQSGSGK